MREKGGIFERFRNSFASMQGHFHILEQRVPVELQMEYFKYSEQLRKDGLPMTDTEYDVYINNWRIKEPLPNGKSMCFLH